MAKWCNHYNCPCEEAVKTGDYLGDCDYVCDGCYECEELEQQE